MKTIWLGTSWKMNKPLSEAMQWCEILAQRLGQVVHPDIQPLSSLLYRHSSGQPLFAGATYSLSDRRAKYA